jgi:hypothetical protein
VPRDEQCLFETFRNDAKEERSPLRFASFVPDKNMYIY